MPNWCMNTLYLTHADPEEIDRAEKALERGKFMNEFLPTPPNEDWYNWRINHWGTKWDVEASTLDNEYGSIRATYDSAWAPPILFYQHLYHIGFEVKALYFEPGVNFCGIFDEGEDCHYSLSGLRSKQVKDLIPPELEVEFGILEYLSESESESDSDSD